MPKNESNVAWWNTATYCLGTFFFAHSLSTLIHECGHAVNGILTGGHVEHIGISAMGWSGTIIDGSEAPLFTAAGGMMWEAGLPLLFLWIAWRTGRSVVFWMVALSIKGLGSSALYMLAGLLWQAGDSADMICEGTGKPTLIITSSALFLLLFPVASLVGPLLRLGRGRTSFRTTALSLFSPLAVCILIFCAYIAVARPPDLPFWLALAAGAGILTVVFVVWIHFSAPWLDRETIRDRAINISPRRALLGLTTGLAVALTVYTLFPE